MSSQPASSIPVVSVQPQPAPPAVRNNFDEWLKKARESVQAKEDEIYIDRPKLAVIAASRACEHVKAATAIGLQYLPPDKFTTTNVIELARFIYEIESDMTDELVTEEDPDDTVDGGQHR